MMGKEVEGEEEKEFILFFLEYESLIGHCALNLVDAGAAAAADTRSFGKIGFETRGRFPC